jgi:putative transposase
MNRAYKYRLYPSKEEERQILLNCEAARFVYNRLLAARLAGERGLYPAQLKKEHSWLREADSLALANAQLHLERAVKNYFSGKYARPKFKDKAQSRLSYTTNCQRGSIRLEKDGGALRLPKLKGVKIKLHRPLPEGALIKSATVSVTPTGKYYAALLLELPDDRENAATNPGQEYIHKANAATTPQMTVADQPLMNILPEGINYPPACLKTEYQIALAQAHLLRTAPGGKNRAKAKARLARLHEKLAAQRRDYLHKLSAALARGEQPPEGISKAGLATLRTFLAYKLK